MIWDIIPEGNVSLTMEKLTNRSATHEFSGMLITNPKELFRLLFVFPNEFSTLDYGSKTPSENSLFDLTELCI